MSKLDKWPIWQWNKTFFDVYTLTLMRNEIRFSRNSSVLIDFLYNSIRSLVLNPRGLTRFCAISSASLKMIGEDVFKMLSFVVLICSMRMLNHVLQHNGLICAFPDSNEGWPNVDPMPGRRWVNLRPPLGKLEWSQSLCVYYVQLLPKYRFKLNKSQPFWSYSRQIVFLIPA